MRTVKSLLLLLSALSFWACSDYESTHSVAPIPIDRAIRTYYSAREVRVKTQNTQSSSMKSPILCIAIIRFILQRIYLVSAKNLWL